MGGAFMKQRTAKAPAEKPGVAAQQGSTADGEGQEKLGAGFSAALGPSPGRRGGGRNERFCLDSSTHKGMRKDLGMDTSSHSGASLDVSSRSAPG